MKYWRKPLDRDSVRAAEYEVSVLKDRCKGCRFCIDFCPRQVLRESDDLNSKGYRPAAPDPSKACINCGFCEVVCPEYAINVVASRVKEAV